MGDESFRKGYGTNGKEGTPGYKRNAFGKCVSGIAQEQGDDEELEKEELEDEELESMERTSRRPTTSESAP